MLGGFAAESEAAFPALAGFGAGGPLGPRLRLSAQPHGRHPVVANKGFAWSPRPGWTMEAGAGSLTVRGGADHVFVLEDLPEPVPGGRFALIEVGHAAQNLALRITTEGLVGCEIGGTVDASLQSLVGLDGVRARVALAYASGLRAH